MEINPLSNITPAPISQVENDFQKKQLSVLNNDIKQKASINYSQNVKDFLYETSSPNPLNSFADNKVKLNNFNIDVTEAYKPLSSGEMIPMYDNFLKGTNNEERFAKQQSTGDKLGNGLLKFGGKTLGAIIGGTAGTINGVAQWIKDGSFQATYDNNFNDWLDDFNTKMDYRLPNYYTEQEKQGSFGENLGTANFWANDVLGGLSFTVGTIVSEGMWAYATGGSSLATAGSRLGMRAGKFFGEGAALTKAINKISNVIKSPVLKTFAKPNLPVELATTLGKAGELANMARFTYTSAGFESGVEARSYMKEAREQYLDSFKQMNGRLPDASEMSDFETNLGDSANNLYAFNLGIVGSSNLAIFGKFLNIKSPIKAPAKWANETLFGVGMRKGASGELEKITASKLQNAFAKAYAIGKVPITEGLWEEGQQSVGKNTAMNWIKSSYDPKYLGNTMDVGTAFSEGFNQTYGSKEGWKEIGVGMIIGLLSGTGMNVARGKGLFSEVNEAKKANEQEIALRNTYSAEKLLDRIHTANRVQAFTEAQEEAEKIGDITGAELSRKSALAAHANNAYNYDYVDEAIEEVSVAINAMDDAVLMKQYGLKSESEVKDLKDTLIKDYKETSDSFVKHREFVEYFLPENEFQDRETANKVKEAVAYELTLGEHSFNFSREVLGEIQKEVASNYTTNGQALSNALEIQDILWSSSREIRKSFVSKQKEVKGVRRLREELEKERLSLESSKNSREDNTSTLNRLNQVTVEIQKRDEELNSLNNELTGLLSTAQLQNPFSNESQPFVTSEDLENVETDLKQVSQLVNRYKESNPQKGYRLEGLISEYSKAKTAFTRYSDLARQLSDSDFGLKGKSSILNKLRSEKSPSKATMEFLEGLQTGMQQSVEERANEAIETNQGVASVINRAAMTMPSKAASKVETVSDIIDNNPYLIEYVGNEQKVQKPTSEEIEEYKALVSKIKRAKNIPNEQVTRVKPNYYAKKGVKTKVTPTELTRFQELNQKMSDWRLYEGAINDEGISIADLIDQEISREQGVESVNVQEELTTDDYVLVSTPTEALPSRSGSEFRDASVIQTYENIKVKVRDIYYEFSHINLSTLVDKMPENTTIVMQTPSEFDESGFATKWNKPIEIVKEEIETYQKIGGTKFSFNLPEGSVEIKVNNQARLSIPINSFNAVKESLGLDIFKQLATKNSYSDLYQMDEEGNFVQMESDFKLQDETNAVAYLPEELYQLEPGSNTFFKINIRDSYNEQLKEDYENGKLTYDQLVDLVKVYNVSGNNKIIGDLKSNQDISEANPVFLQIRKKAADVLLNDQLAESMITIPFTAKVQHVLLGTPNISMRATTDGVVPQTIPLTEQALDVIVDFGYIEGGALTLRNETKNVRTEFIDKLAKKANVPVIVFKQGKFFVAYPVSLVKRTASKSDEVANILANRKLNNTQKATEINNYLTQNRINPKDFGLFYVTQDNQNMFDGAEMSTQLSTAVAALAGLQDSVDVEQWINGEYDKDQLIEDIEITIDLENRPLRSPKVIIDFNGAASTENVLSWYEEWVNNGAVTDEKINEIANKVVAEALSMDGLNALSRQEYEIYIAESEKIESAMKNIYKMSAEKEKLAKEEKRKKC